MQSVNLSRMLKALYEIEAQEGKQVTLLGIGPMSLPVIRASFELAKEKDFPIMFIASRNQVDAKELGGGYVCNWDQKGFCRAIEEIAREVDFNGLYYTCRDHGGPWQRDNERAMALDEKAAMDLGKQSYLVDLISGFDLLHIDPTKDPHEKGIVPMEKVISRTVELIQYVEDERNKLQLPEIGYEVGTEETNGGLTTIENYEAFIRMLADELQARALPLPNFIVGQTGTLTRLVENVGHFNASIAESLSATARKYGVGLKEHNADYLSDGILLEHPILGITAANVAPEFGVVETRAYLELAALEEKQCQLGKLKKGSNVSATLRREAVTCERWRKWMVGELATVAIDTVLSDEKLTGFITEICGHYTFDTPEVKQEIQCMFHNLEDLGMRPQYYVKDCLKRSLDRYVSCLNLEGLTSALLQKL